ncbi:MAG: methyltransferase domain-containing protein [Victivallaceae bacterium]|nr:methyltransferase domain-containing protein [Victivallaceae bacterium]
MTKRLLFKRFLANPGVVGALWPSSSALCREITAEINLGQARSIAELGPGTGVITDEILSVRNPQAQFIIVELDSKMFHSLKQRHPDLQVVNDSAENLPEIMKTAAITHFDAVVSGLPWAIFPARQQARMLRVILNSLREGGYFTTFAYLQGLVLPAGQRFKKLLKKTFSEVALSRIVWGNVPPAIVYRCRK